MKKKIVLPVLALCLLFSGCEKGIAPQKIERQSLSSLNAASSTVSSETVTSTVSNISQNSDPSAQLKAVLEKCTTHQIVSFQSFALGNGQIAAFALVVGGEVWYITASDAQKLKTDIAFPMDQPDKTFLWNVDGVKIFKCGSSSGGSSSHSYAWYVKNGKPIELPYTGMRLSYLGNGQFTTVGDTFDAVFTDGLATGHTYKIYYLYWAGDGLKEYGGVKITQKQLLKMKGAQAVLDTITKSGHVIDDIYYRANNIININYHSGDRKNGNFNNVTLVYKNNTVTPKPIESNSGTSATESFNEKNLSDFSYGGIYQTALFPKIAAYPDQFPINQAQ